MPVLNAPESWTHELPNARFRSLATPTRGTRENSVWKVSLIPGQAGLPHSLTREEIFVVLSGVACMRSDAGEQLAFPGDVLLVPAGSDFSVQAEGAEAVELLCCFPVGGQARLANGDLISPPWAQ